MTHTGTEIIDPGDLSQKDAKTLDVMARQYIGLQSTTAGGNAAGLVRELREWVETEAWKKLYPSWEAFIARYFDDDALPWLTELPQLIEEGKSNEEIVLGDWGGDHKSESFKENQADNVSLKHGNGKEYLAARIAKDHPDVNVDDYPSVRQAAIACGIVKVKTAPEQVRHWWAKCTPQEQHQLREETQ